MVFGIITSALIICAYQFSLFAKLTWLVYVVYATAGLTLLECIVAMFRGKNTRRILTIIIGAATVGIFVYFFAYKVMNWSFLFPAA